MLCIMNGPYPCVSCIGRQFFTPAALNKVKKKKEGLGQLKQIIYSQRPLEKQGLWPETQNRMERNHFFFYLNIFWKQKRGNLQSYKVLSYWVLSKTFLLPPFFPPSFLFLPLTSLPPLSPHPPLLPVPSLLLSLLPLSSSLLFLNKMLLEVFYK